MRIELKKFGTLLTSRPAGKEAYAAFLPTLAEIGPDENVEVDFDGITVFSPSWGDEFLTPLFEKYGSRVALLHTEKNPSVRLTLTFLKQIGAGKFSEDK
ncbi:MAG: DUF4325 domain-containing protein [Candidatus Moraniibacteriota bacterium]